jgi:hypothetical protein
LIRAATSTAAMAMITWECHSRPGQAQAGWRPGRGRRRRSVGSVPRSSPGPTALLDGLPNGRSPPPRTGQHLPVSSPLKVSAQPFGPHNDSFGTPRTGPDDRADSRSGGYTGDCGVRFWVAARWTVMTVAIRLCYPAARECGSSPDGRGRRPPQLRAGGRPGDRFRRGHGGWPTRGRRRRRRAGAGHARLGALP